MKEVRIFADGQWHKVIWSLEAADSEIENGNRSYEEVSQESLRVYYEAKQERDP